jgi:cob(I)alamin adenosyltransferase
LSTQSPRALVLVHTGDGKGKTTAALGLALRAVGQGLRVLMVQFIKGDTDTGENKAAQRLAPEFELLTLGAGFVLGEWTEEDLAAAREAWRVAREAILQGRHDLVILDEVCFVVAEGVVPVGDVLEALAARPGHVHVLLTGRNAPEEFVAAADLVTEMRCVKHPFDAGIPAQRGIEY